MPDSGKSYPLLVAVSIGYLLTAGLYWQSVFWRDDHRDDPAQDTRQDLGREGNEKPMASSRLSEAVTENPART